MRRLLPVLLLGLVAAADEGVVGDGKTFELPLPPGDEWSRKESEGDTKVFLRTVFKDSDPEATADVRVMVQPLKAYAEKTNEAIAREWAPAMEGVLKDGSLVDEGKSALGGEEAWFRDFANDWARLTWHLSRKNGNLYVFHVLRTNVATRDADLEEEIAGMRTSLRFLGGEAPGAPRPPEPPQKKPEEIPRETRTLQHWRLEYVKPEGLIEVAPKDLAKSETDAGVVAKFGRTAEDSLLMVRIYAQSDAGRKFTIEQLAEQKLKRFREQYDETRRLKPVEDKEWKPPLVDRAIRLVLVGRGRRTQTTRWHLAECRNERQYQLEIYVSGGTPDRWQKEIDEILAGFRPLKE